MNDPHPRSAFHAEVFAALANPVRHELMHVLCEAPRTPSELALLLGVTRPNVSQHLAVLHRVGLVHRRRQGSRVYWSIVDPRLSEACALFDEVLAPELLKRAQMLAVG